MCHFQNFGCRLFGTEISPPLTVLIQEVICGYKTSVYDHHAVINVPFLA